MSSVSPELASALRNLDDAVHDFRNASIEEAQDRLEQVAHFLADEPMGSYLAALPRVDFETWLRSTITSPTELGLTALTWPRDRPSSVAMRVAFVRSMAAREVRMFDILMSHFRPGRSRYVPDAIAHFADKFLSPFLRDLNRLAEERPLSHALGDLLGRFPSSGDAKVDVMINTAAESFRDPAPAARALAVEKLWDAWERLKTLDDMHDKKVSARLLLDQAAAEPRFRELLETEARALTNIGNSFHIRHFETARTPIERPEQLDYLFHRLLALISLLLRSRTPSAP